MPITVVLDSDGQHDCETFRKCSSYPFGGDFVIGSRFVDGGGSETACLQTPWYQGDYTASNLSSDLAIQDTQSGFRAFSRKALDRLRFDSEGMELSLEMLEDAHKEKRKSKKSRQ